MNLSEIGAKVQSKRLEAGLLQEQVAKLSGLSRVTINQLENGTLKDLGYSKLKNVLDILGIEMSVAPSAPLKSALSVAARNISTSYTEVISPEMLSDALRSGEAPERFHPHLMAFLDETPLPVAIRAVREAATPDSPPKKILKNLALWSRQWRTCRAVWS